MKLSTPLRILAVCLFLAFLVVALGASDVYAKKPTPTPKPPTKIQPPGGNQGAAPLPHQKQGRITNADRIAASKNAAKARAAAGVRVTPNTKMIAPNNKEQLKTPGPYAGVLGTPDYWGTVPNSANSPFPTSIGIFGDGEDALVQPVVTGGAVTGVTILNGGSDYTAAATTAVVVGGNGAGAVLGVPVIVNGGIAALTLLNGGSGYSATPTVTISAPPAGGTQATAAAIVTSGVIRGFTVSNVGAGYVIATVTITDGTGLGASAVAVVGNGVIASIPVTSGGTGYDTPATGLASYGLRKFVDTLPNLVVGVADTTSFPVSLNGGPAPAADYYEVALVQYTQKMHSDLPPTLLEGYVQILTPAIAASCANGGAGVPLTYLSGSPILNAQGTQVIGCQAPSYLGPVLVAQKNTPIRVKFTNYLPTNAGGNLFIPVDTTYMGAGEGPVDANGNPCDSTMQVCANYSQNRATLHLHGGNTPWISDGTPHQWTTPAGENTKYPKGVSVGYVPDQWYDGSGNPITACMGQTTCTAAGATNNPGPGSLTFYYTNQQSARLMFYHDHAYGITRLNVYGGEAAGYLIQDLYEDDLEDGTNVTGINPSLKKVLPADNIELPLVFQDKTFVPDTKTGGQLAAEDPTWDTTKYGGYGGLWFPHIYMTNQNPWDISGANAMGRWDWGPWFWPPFTNQQYGPLPNPYACGGKLANAATCATEPPQVPSTPNPSGVPEGFMDTPLVNGMAYPVLTVAPQAYRFQILNASNDRTLNL